MNRLPLLFLGVFATLLFSWAGIIWSNQVSYGALQPHRDASDDSLHPARVSGQAEAGREVYRDLGCVYCHSQQVRNLQLTRRETVNGQAQSVRFNPDIDRGWGNRPSVARDYVREPRVYLGTMRTGPDLRNVGGRALTAEWHYQHLYNPQITSRGSIMPPYAFLFQTRPVQGEPSPKALRLPAKYAPDSGQEIVPTARAEALVAYLLSLNDSYEDYPEVKTPGILLDAEGRIQKPAGPQKP